MKFTFPIAKVLLIATAVLCMFSSCKTQKDFLYIADMNEGEAYPILQRYEPKVIRGDKLQITVSAKNPELAVPFNVEPGSVKVSGGGNVEGTSKVHYYRVDNEGNINFPVLGQLYVAGMTLPAVSDMIRERIIEGNYIKDPIVTTEFKNFHYTVLGAANSNGNYTVDGEKVTILEAIAQAGDLASNADLGKISVIREEGNNRKLMTLDIRKSDIFNSPAFYLAQNDIIYVQPKRAKNENKSNFIQWFTLALSAVGTTCTVIWATKK